MKKFFRRMKRLFQKLCCVHGRTFTFHPDNASWQRDGVDKGKMNHGAQVKCCMNCGKTWGANYAE